MTSVAPVASAAPAAPSLSHEIDRLRPRNNHTNWIYIAQVYAIMTATAAATMAFYDYQQTAGLALGWSAAVTLLAVVVMGASQHQLGGATHEATHYLLFRNRILNELVSDWLCMFPLYTSTYQFRVHHLAHHQFVNDPQHDPDQSQLRDSGHWLDFPVTHVTFVWTLLKQLWIPNLVRYTLTRARYSSLGDCNSPYHDAAARPSKWPTRIGILYAVATPIIIGRLVPLQRPWVLAAAIVGMWALAAGYYAVIPRSAFPGSRIRPVISHRVTWISRITYLTLLYGGVAVAELTTGWPFGWTLLLLWIVPLFTTFPLFMILRQVVQHGNADRGRLSNTRVFRVNPLIRYAVFPFGMDYHLPHHLYASIPHYRLAELHTLLSRDPQYAREGVVVEGYFRAPASNESRRPTVLEVLGPKHAPREAGEIYIDNHALDDAEIVPADIHPHVRAQPIAGWPAHAKPRQV